MRLVAALFVASAFLPAAFAADPGLHGAYKFDDGGWTYVHLAGTPEQVGYEHGYLLARQIEDLQHVYAVEDENNNHKDWAWLREKARIVMWPHVEPEYQAEMKGIAAGLKAQGSRLDLWDVVAMNSHTEISEYYLPWLAAREHTPVPAAAKAPGRCSAFIATGSATKDGKIVIAHSNWSSYADGERWNYVFDIVPAHGQHFVMDGAPGLIDSGDDFGVNQSGLMITETTLPAINVFDPNGIPEFDRARKAMQYAASIGQYAAIMRKGNNGGYANTWLVGDRKTSEIANLELGLHATPLAIKKDGFFVSSNFAADPRIIKEDTDGFDPGNPASSMNARRVTATAFMKKHYGQIDASLAEAFLSDHYDSYEKKRDPGMRSLCGHEETSSRGEPVWGDAPYTPGGAVTGKVMDATLAAKLSFIGRSGHPCGSKFIAAQFLAARPQFAWQKPILRDMIAGPWTTFQAGQRGPELQSASR